MIENVEKRKCRKLMNKITRKCRRKWKCRKWLEYWKCRKTLIIENVEIKFENVEDDWIIENVENE